MQLETCPLKPRQVQVVQLLADGKSAFETAIILGMAYRTAQSHLADAKANVGVHKNVALVATALRNGWIS